MASLLWRIIFYFAIFALLVLWAAILRREK
jgi:hypothetical protein